MEDSYAIRTGRGKEAALNALAEVMTVIAGAEIVGNFTMSLGKVEIEWVGISDLGGESCKIPAGYGAGAGTPPN